MRIFIYDDNEKLLDLLCNSSGLSPTKYINNLIKSHATTCQKYEAEVDNDKHKGNDHGRNRLTKS